MKLNILFLFFQHCCLSVLIVSDVGCFLFYSRGYLSTLKCINVKCYSKLALLVSGESMKKTIKLNELEVKIEKNNEFHNANHNISANKIHSLTAQIKDNQIKTESKISSIESENTKNSEKGQFV